MLLNDLNPIRALLIFVILGAGVSCTSTPEPKPVPPEHYILLDNDVGRKLASDFEKKIAKKYDYNVHHFLTGIAKRLIENEPRLRGSPIEVFVIEDRSDRWECYGLPSVRVYLSKGLIQKVEFESEIAAATAFQLAHVMRRHVLRHLEETVDLGYDYEEDEGDETIDKTLKHKLLNSLFPLPLGVPVESIGYFGPEGILSYSKEEQIEAVEVAVEIMYSSGFDPRGLFKLWERYLANPVYSPFTKEQLAVYIEKTKKSIVLFPPLRNPYFQSDTFKNIQDRIHAL